MKNIIVVFVLLVSQSVYSQWKKVNQLDGFGHKIIMFDSMSGLAATNEGLMETKDGWKSYKNLLPNFLVIDFDISEYGVIACTGVDYDLVQMGYRVSDDGGKTWTKTNHKTMEGHSRILMKGEDTIIAHGGRTETLISYNAGYSWKVLKKNNDLVTWGGLFMLNSGNLLLSSAVWNEKPRKVKLFNGNLNDTAWNEIASYENNSAPRRFLYAGNEIYSMSGDGIFYKSKDNGASFIKIGNQLPHEFSNIFFVNSKLGFLCGGGFSKRPLYGVIMRTYNGGKTWEHTEVKEATRGITSVYFLNSKLGFAIDYAGNVFKTTNAGGVATPDYERKDTTKVIDPKTSLKETESLYNISLFPNPSTGLLNITWEYKTPANTNLLVLDGRGRVVFQQAMPNGNELELNLPKLSPGLYFVSIATPEGREVLRWVKE